MQRAKIHDSEAAIGKVTPEHIVHADGRKQQLPASSSKPRFRLNGVI